MEYALDSERSEYAAPHRRDAGGPTTRPSVAALDTLTELGLIGLTAPCDPTTVADRYYFLPQGGLDPQGAQMGLTADLEFDDYTTGAAPRLPLDLQYFGRQYHGSADAKANVRPPARQKPSFNVSARRQRSFTPPSHRGDVFSRLNLQRSFDREDSPQPPGSSDGMTADHNLPILGSTTTASLSTDAAGAVNHRTTDNNVSASTQSVPPASLACRKRLTMTSGKSSRTLQKLIATLRQAVETRQWEAALKVALQFCCCSESETVPDDDEDLSNSSPNPVSIQTLMIPHSAAALWAKARVSRPSIMGYNDFAMLCASLFERLSHRTPGRPPIKLGSPSTVGTQSLFTPLSEGAKEVRQIICDVQTLLLMSMASKLDLQPCEQIRMRNLAISTLFSLVWHPNALEALGPIFFNVQGRNSNDCFCSFLIHWGGTGILQHVFEMFVIMLVKASRWRATLWLLSCTALGERLLLPSICQKEGICCSPFLPEVADISSCRSEIMVRLRFPVTGIIDMLLGICSYQCYQLENSEPWPFKLGPPNLVLSILPMVLCKPLSNEILVHRGWHDRCRGECPVSIYGPEQMLEYLNAQVAHPQGEKILVGESDLVFEHALDEVIPAFVFLGDPGLCAAYLDLLQPSTEDEPAWVPSQPSVLTSPELLSLPRTQRRLSALSEQIAVRANTSYLNSATMKSLWDRLADHPEALERCFCVVELAARATEAYFVVNKPSPYNEVIENNTRESLLQMSKRTVGELTGCTLGRVDLCYLRLLESYETTYGLPSLLPGLIGSRKEFCPSLNMSWLLHSLLLTPWTKGNPLRLACESVGDDSFSAIRLVRLLQRTINTESCCSENFIFPTFLPEHVARLIPAWLAARAHGVAYDESRRQNVEGGWRILSREILIAASRCLPPHPRAPIIAPHLDATLLEMFLLMYVAAANPRALHLFARWVVERTGTKRDAHFHEGLLGILDRAVRSKFVLIAEAVGQVIHYDSPEDSSVLARIMDVYVAADDGVRAFNLLDQLRADPSCDSAYRHAQVRLMAAKLKTSAPEDGTKTSLDRTHRASGTQQSKEEKLRTSLSIVKSLAANNDVRGAINYFHALRKSPGGVLDVSVANKIMHLCVTNNHVTEAEEILRLMRADAHNEINGMDFIPGACVRPDVVTCNIVMKGLAKQSPPRMDDIDKTVRQMEDPFHLGGDGVKADQVTFNTAINAAVAAGDFDKTWHYFTVMRNRNIKIDGFVCSVLVRQLGPATKPEIIDEIAKLVEELDLYEDPVLLASMVDVYSRLRDTGRLKRLLDKFLSRNPNPSAYSIGTLIKGYGRCGKIPKAAALWRKLEALSADDRQDARWTPYILSCVVDCFVPNGMLDQAMCAAEKAKSLNILLSDVQLSEITRLCVLRQRFGEALKMFRYMREHSIYPCNVTYNILVHTCVQAGDPETALEILNDMSKNAKHPPDVVTYTTVIKGMCDRGDMDSAMDLFNSLPSRGIVADIVTYNTILEGFAKAGNLEKVESVFNELFGHRVKPTCFTLTILVKFYGRRRMIDNVLQLVQSLPHMCKFQLDTFAYTATIAACSWNGKLKEAIYYFHEMRRNFGASARTYGTLIGGNVKKKDWRCLSVVLRLALEDKIELEKRDLYTLHNLFNDWYDGSLPDTWYHSGFDQQQIRVFLSSQRKPATPQQISI